MKHYFLSILFFLLLQNLFAQQSDSVATMAPKKITLENPKEAWLPNPKTATILSAVVPGLGQAYNRSYWKIPIIYAIEGTLIYLIFYNNGYYKDFKEAYKTRIDTSSTKQLDKYYDNPNYRTADQLRLARDDYRRNRDLSIVVAAAIYGIQILDANVDAHLRTFKINKELSLELNPFFYKYNTYNLASGVSLSLKFDQQSDNIRPKF